jgi:RNA polymerase sigma factor (sigma-70 family)
VAVTLNPLSADGEPEVVRGLRRGDPVAFDRAFQAHRARVYSFLARLSGRRDLAEDLLQETFLRLASRAHALTEDTRLLLWLFTVARNLWISHCRRTLLDPGRLDALAFEGIPGNAPSPLEELAGSELAKRLERAVAALPPAYREVILLVAVERLDAAEAATILELEPATLRQRLSRASGMVEAALAAAERAPKSTRSLP